MSTSTAAQVKVQPLVCPSCAGPVPLADADAVPCPYCGHRVPVPEDLRRLRRELATLDKEREVAERLYRRIGKAPPRVLRVFAFFDTGWFWMGALGFWLVGGVVFFAVATPWFTAHVLGFNARDVLDENVQMAITWGGTLGSVALGLLASGYSRKRVVTLGALQVALAASPPSSAGGPARCRRCAAALAVPPGALYARCDYCQADNLVEIPHAWVGQAHKLVKRVAVEESHATRDVKRALDDLRSSLITRLIIGLLLVVPGVLMFLTVGDSGGFDSHLGFDVSTADVFKAPFELDLPVWRKDDVPTWKCGEGGMYFSRTLDHCTSKDLCMAGFLVALRGKRPFHVGVRGLPAAVQLDMRDTEMLDERWKRVALESARPDGTTFIPPYTGWYRVLVVGEQKATVQVCDGQD